ncbi:hypothetical protein AB0D84_32710 [Streptomyces sp. NPDC048193]|uniref:hypothetical protein n=1 Tax=unclassified Streptomyces TaxID=2593676 RepID=UPI003429C34E
MSDVTRQPGGNPAERDTQTHGTLGEGGQGAGIRAEHAVGAREDVTPGLRTRTTGTAPGTDGTRAEPGTDGSHGAHAAPGTEGSHGVHAEPGTEGSHGVHAEPGTEGSHGVHAAPGTDGSHGAHAAAGTDGGSYGAPEEAGGLLPHEECDRLGQRLHHAVTEFVDAPRASVEEADRVLEELAARFTDAVTHRRRTLRTSWQDSGEGSRATSTDTEQLRLALRDYRELADRLMHV